METNKNDYQIVNTLEEDLEFTYQLFEEAIAYQQRKGYSVWQGYDKKALQNDVHQQLQYKIVIDDTIACVFSICYADPIIWREKEQANAMYLHRIVVNPHLKGQKQFQKILDWSIQHAQQRGTQFIRMDTWGDNPTIIDYYKSFGFRFIENYTTPNSEELPTQHRNLYLTLLEFEIDLYTK